MVKYNGKKIIYTFKHGACITVRDICLFLIGTVFFFALGITMFIVGYSDDDKFLDYSVLISGCLAGSFCLGILIFYLCKAKLTDREISEWLKDESLFEACAEAHQFEKQGGRGSVYYKLGISFEHDGEKYSRFVSRTEKVGYFRRLNNIVEENRLNINILYSPKYGEVMVLNNSEARGERS